MAHFWCSQERHLLTGPLGASGGGATDTFTSPLGTPLTYPTLSTARSTFYNQLIVLDFHVRCVFASVLMTREIYTHLTQMVLGVR